ncbi:MAG: hypothetical protein AB7S86_17140 [Hydrogenophaga sp.]
MTDFAKMASVLKKFLCPCALSIHDVGVPQEAPRSSTAASQGVHFSCGFSVNNFDVAALQQGFCAGLMVCFLGFLPTMKPQLSQLPWIVGYGRVSS